MKLGTETGSLVNHMLSTSQEQEIKVGMGATLLWWSDRTAATVTAWDDKVVTVTEDHARRIDGNGMSDSQTYEYEPNPAGRVYHFRRDKLGRWRTVYQNEKGRFVLMGTGLGLSLGARRAFHDFSF
ncbi:MAG TPA: hypothetical protein VIV56_16810 [Gemmatimonadales bacterium]